MDEKDIRRWLEVLPGTRRAANGILIDAGDSTLYVQEIRKGDPDLAPQEHLFVALCSKNESFRLREIKSAHDYLLRLRANAIADSPRWYVL